MLSVGRICGRALLPWIGGALLLIILYPVGALEGVLPFLGQKINQPSRRPIFVPSLRQRSSFLPQAPVNRAPSYSAKSLIRTEGPLIGTGGDEIHPRWDFQGLRFVWSSTQGQKIPPKPPEGQGASLGFRPFQAPPPGAGGAQVPQYSVWIRLATGAQRQVTKKMGNQIFPALSPDGRWVAYATTPEPPPPPPQEGEAPPGEGGGPGGAPAAPPAPQEPPKALPYSIEILDLTTLSDDPEAQPCVYPVAAPGVSNALHPSFSPDGRMVIFSGQDAKTGKWDLYIAPLPLSMLMTPAGECPENKATPRAQKVRFTSSPDGTLNDPAMPDEIEPVFSPDGNWVAFTRGTFSLTEVPAESSPLRVMFSYSKTHIWVAPVRRTSGGGVALGQPRQITYFQAFDPVRNRFVEAFEKEPAWTPGLGLVFVTNRDDTNGDRYPDVVRGVTKIFSIPSIMEQEGAGVPPSDYARGRNRARKEALGVPVPITSNDEHPSVAPGSTYPVELGMNLIFSSDFTLDKQQFPSGHDIWQANNQQENDGFFALNALPRVEPRLAEPGASVRITASVKSLDPKTRIAEVLAFVKNPDQKLFGVASPPLPPPRDQQGTTGGRPRLPGEPEPQDQTQQREPTREELKPFNVGGPRFVGTAFFAQTDGLAFDLQSEVGYATVDLIPLYDDGPAGGHGDAVAGDGIYTNVWTTPLIPMDFYLDIAVRGDRAVGGNDPFSGGLAFDYFDNAWGFSTKKFEARHNLLFVSDYTGGQSWIQSRTRSGRNVSYTRYPVESYWLSRPHPEFTLEDTPRRVHTWPGPFGDLWDVLGEKSPFQDEVDIWRTQCRDAFSPIPGQSLADAINLYKPRTVKQATPTGAPKDQFVADRAIIWAAPYIGNLTVGPDTLFEPAVQQLLVDYLRQGGRLLLSGQDVAWALTQGGTKSNSLLNLMHVRYQDDADLDVTNDRPSNRHVLNGNTEGYNPISVDPYPSGQHWMWGSTPPDPPGTLYLPGPFGFVEPPHSFQDSKLDGAWNQLQIDSVIPIPSGQLIPKQEYSYAEITQTEGQEPGQAAIIFQDEGTKPFRTVYFAFGLEGVHRGYTTKNVGGFEFVVCLNRPAQIVHNAICWLTTGAIAGRVFDSQLGRPIPGAVVRAVSAGRQTDIYGRPVQGQVMGAAVTDAEGRYIIQGLEPDSYQLFAAKPGFIFQHSTVVNVHGTKTAQGPETNLVMTRVPPGAIEGSVLDANGKPVIGAQIVAKNQTEDLSATGTSDDQGQFRLNAVPIGTYDVTAQASGLGTVTVQGVQVSSNAVTQVTLRFTTSGQPTQPVEVSGFVRDSADQAVPGARITFETLQGTKIAEVTSGGDGAFTVNLLPGTYRVRITLGEQTLSQALTVPSEGLKGLVLRFGVAPPPPQTRTITIPAGVQLVSLPADFSGQPVAQVLGTTDFKMAAWTGERYALYPEAPADAFRVGRGYFLALNRAITVTIPVQGVSTGTFSIPLQPGWNLIGTPSFHPVNWNNEVRVLSGGRSLSLSEAAQQRLMSVSLWGFDGRNYLPAATMEPGKGYWVRALQPVTLILPVGPE